MALMVADNLDDGHAQIAALTSLLRAYIAAGRQSMVQLYGDRVIRIAREQGEPFAEITAINLLVDFLLAQGHAPRTVAYAERGFEIARAKEDWGWQLTKLSHLKSCAMENKGFERHLSAWRDAKRQSADCTDIRRWENTNLRNLRQSVEGV